VNKLLIAYQGELVDIIINRPQTVLAQSEDGVAIEEPTTTLTGYFNDCDELYVYLKPEESSEAVMAVAHASIMFILLHEEVEDTMIMDTGELLN